MSECKYCPGIIRSPGQRDFVSPSKMKHKQYSVMPCICSCEQFKGQDTNSYGCGSNILCSILCNSSYAKIQEDEKCSFSVLCGLLGCLLGDNSEASYCNGSFICSGPLIAVGNGFCGLGFMLLGLAGYFGTDKASCSCCCFELCSKDTPKQIE